jgi:hypothetical protein
MHPGGGAWGRREEGQKSEEDEGDLEVTIISRDGPDKLIVQHRAWPVTFNWTQVTLAVTSESSQRWFHYFERQVQKYSSTEVLAVIALGFSPVLCNIHMGIEHN